VLNNSLLSRASSPLVHSQAHRCRHVDTAAAAAAAADDDDVLLGSHLHLDVSTKPFQPALHVSQATCRKASVTSSRQTNKHTVTDSHV